jgi:hypothetical protein
MKKSRLLNLCAQYNVIADYRKHLSLREKCSLSGEKDSLYIVDKNNRMVYVYDEILKKLEKKIKKIASKMVKIKVEDYK